MEILKEGDRGYGVSRSGARVFVEYRYVELELDSGERVANVLAGVDPHSGSVLAIPAQSLPRIRAVSKVEEKRHTIVARLPLELEDALMLVTEELVAPTGFPAALVRFYLAEASRSPALARRIAELARSPLARRPPRGGLSVRLPPTLFEGALALAHQEGLTRSELVRGIALAAAEDVLDRHAPERKDRLAAVATAI